MMNKGIWVGKKKNIASVFLLNLQVSSCIYMPTVSILSFKGYLRYHISVGCYSGI